MRFTEYLTECVLVAQMMGTADTGVEEGDTIEESAAKIKQWAELVSPYMSGSQLATVTYIKEHALLVATGYYQ